MPEFYWHGCNQTNKHVDLSEIDPGLNDTLWYHNPLRFIQTNLSEIDAKMDVDIYIQTLVMHQPILLCLMLEDKLLTILQSCSIITEIHI